MSEMQEIQAQLVIRLLANETVVAESKDAALWQRVLAAVMGQSTGLGVGGKVGGQPEGADQLDDSPIGRFAAELEVTREEVVGALDPTQAPPFIHLDMRAWEAFSGHVPTRGPGAVPPLVLGATALALWFRAIGEGNPSLAQTRAVLATIGLQDKNPTRTLGNCDWLQNRSGTIVLNPAMVSRAAALVRAYCTREAP